MFHQGVQQFLSLPGVNVFILLFFFLFRSNSSHVFQVPVDRHDGHGVSFPKRSVINDLPSLGETQQAARLLRGQGKPVLNKLGRYPLLGYTSFSSALVFCAPKKPHCVFVNSELCLWHGEDLRDFSESDNGGKTCADVYGLPLA